MRKRRLQIAIIGFFVCLVCICGCYIRKNHPNDKALKNSEIITQQKNQSNTEILKTYRDSEIQVISSTESKTACLTDMLDTYDIHISEIPNFQRVFGCSSFIQYRSMDGKITLNFYIEEGKDMEGILYYAETYFQNPAYSNVFVSKKEIPVENDMYHIIQYQYKNLEVPVVTLFFQKELKEQTYFVMEVTQRNSNKSAEVSNFKEIFQSNYININ